MKLLYCWWTPDHTFIDLSPAQVVYPATDYAAHAVGDLRSANPETLLTKWAHPQLSLVALDAYNLSFPWGSPSGSPSTSREVRSEKLFLFTKITLWGISL